MVGANGLVPDGRQVIWNHNDNIGLLRLEVVPLCNNGNMAEFYILNTGGILRMQTF